MVMASAVITVVSPSRPSSGTDLPLRWALTIFQVPNKFFEADGRVVDAAGEDWDATWGHTAKR